MATTDVRISVKIEAQTGAYEVVSDTLTIPDGVLYFRPQDGRYTYPDSRAIEVRFWQDDSGTWKCIGKESMSPAAFHNYAYCAVGPLEFGVFIGGETFPDAPNNKELGPGRIMASDVDVIFSFEAERTYYIGSGEDNRIVGFAVNALPMSEGQFGQYPLYVFTSSSIWALEQGGDDTVAFARRSPVSNKRGAISNRSITNIGQAVCIVDSKGVYLLNGGQIDSRMGKPVNEDLSGDVFLGLYMQDNIEELWMAYSGGVYGFSFEHGRWFSIDREVRYFFYDGTDLLEINDSNEIRTENLQLSTAVPVDLKLSPVHFGFPDRLKRIIALYVRGQLEVDGVNDLLTLAYEDGTEFVGASVLRVRPKHRSDYSFTLQVTGQMDPTADHYLHRVDAEFEGRYPARQRSTSLPSP